MIDSPKNTWFHLNLTSDYRSYISSYFYHNYFTNFYLEKNVNYDRLSPRSVVQGHSRRIRF